MSFDEALDQAIEAVRLRGMTAAPGATALDLVGTLLHELDIRGLALDKWRSLGDAAADEIESRWHAHTDEEGFGPVSLVRRLRSWDGALYTAEGWRERQAVVAYLRAHGLADTAEQIKRGDHRSER